MWPMATCRVSSFKLLPIWTSTAVHSKTACDSPWKLLRWWSRLSGKALENEKRPIRKTCTQGALSETYDITVNVSFSHNVGHGDLRLLQWQLSYSRWQSQRAHSGPGEEERTVVGSMGVQVREPTVLRRCLMPPRPLSSRQYLSTDIALYA